MHGMEINFLLKNIYFAHNLWVRVFPYLVLNLQFLPNCSLCLAAPANLAAKSHLLRVSQSTCNVRRILLHVSYDSIPIRAVICVSHIIISYLTFLHSAHFSNVLKKQAFLNTWPIRACSTCFPHIGNLFFSVVESLKLGCDIFFIQMSSLQFC
jgi:hypothetical protein